MIHTKAHAGALRMGVSFRAFVLAVAGHGESRTRDALFLHKYDVKYYINLNMLMNN